MTKTVKVTPSPQQREIYRAILDTSDNVAIQATAGAGKTTTLVEASKLIPKNKRIIFLSFSNQIVGELKERLPSNIECSTLHSLGAKYLFSFYRSKLKVTEFKAFNFFKDIEQLKTIKEKEINFFKFNVMKLANLARMTLSELDTETIQAIADKYDVSTLYGEVPVTIEVLNRMHEYNNKLRGFRGVREIDFTDMINIPATNKLVNVDQYDYILLDEAQDLNACQHAFIERILKPKTGRLISVGDGRQAIYSFMGADLNSFNKLAARPRTVTLPLSVSYRCAKKIVELAQTVYNEIQPYEGAEEGIVRAGTVEELKTGDFVLCRNNKPLVLLYFKLLEKGIKSKILGKEIGENLLALLKKTTGMTKQEGMLVLGEMLDFLAEKLKERGIKNPAKHKSYKALSEKIMVIGIIASRFKYMYQVEKELTIMFDDRVKGVTLCTIHKSKGLEADRVFLLGKGLLYKYAKEPWEFEAEKNLEFVAYTRAKKEFIFVTGMAGVEEEEEEEELNEIEEN